mmetsp:Transcript_95592/g.270478  ORF Transcript_95592/g.270478 Transcript_95592/m.270478 type:complete len:431 (+) Transcript_95592:647-1939(+)
MEKGGAFVVPEERLSNPPAFFSLNLRRGSAGSPPSSSLSSLPSPRVLSRPISCFTMVLHCTLIGQPRTRVSSSISRAFSAPSRLHISTRATPLLTPSMSRVTLTLRTCPACWKARSTSCSSAMDVSPAAITSHPHVGFGCRFAASSDSVFGSCWNSSSTSQRSLALGPATTRPWQPLYCAAPTRPCKSTFAPTSNSSLFLFFFFAAPLCRGSATFSVESHSPGRPPLRCCFCDLSLEELRLLDELDWLPEAWYRARLSCPLPLGFPPSSLPPLPPPREPLPPLRSAPPSTESRPGTKLSPLPLPPPPRPRSLPRLALLLRSRRGAPHLKHSLRRAKFLVEQAPQSQSLLVSSSILVPLPQPPPFPQPPPESWPLRQLASSAFRFQFRDCPLLISSPPPLPPHAPAFPLDQSPLDQPPPPPPLDQVEPPPP